MTWRVPRHVFQTRAPSRNSAKYRADDLCGSLICEYFCWMLGDPHFFFGRSFPFLILSIILKNKKICTWEVLIIFHILFKEGPIGSWIQVCGINDIGSKDLSNKPIYAVLNTHNLDMILQLKYMPIVMNPARVASSDWREMLLSVIRLIFKTSSVTPDFFYVFLI